MSTVYNYVLPTDVLPSVGIEIGGLDPLFGLMTSFDLSCHGLHQIFPYATYSGSTFDTYSVIRSMPGSMTFSGILVSTDATVAALLAGLGTMEYGSPVLFQVVNPSTGATLGAWNLSDYRLNRVSLSMVALANMTMVRGTFGATFRKLTDVSS